MNKKDMLNAANKAEEIGVDPDTVMMYTVEEYSKAHGDEVDTFDEDKDHISGLRAEIFNISEQVEEVMSEIELTERLIERSHNWAEKHELTQELRDLNNRLTNLNITLRKLMEEAQNLEDNFKTKYTKR
ncbi:MAG: hypothetical protein E7164_04890 [Firmicutes bacterium]|nr:hypothetical protein [Bacillota bacterium]